MVKCVIIQPPTPMTPYEPFILNSLNVCIYAYHPFPPDPLKASMWVNRTYATVYIIQPLTPMTPYAPFILNSLNICIYAYIPSLMTPFGPLCD